MAYTNSPLVSYKKLSPNHSGQRTHSIDRITPHCVVGQCSVETLGSIFASKNRQASCNYGIGADGRVLLCVDEKNRSWCSSSSSNDQRAVTIECASDTKAPYAFKDVVYQKLIALCVDICKRNGKKKLLWLGDKDKTLSYKPKSDEMILTVHRWFANKSCPGDWLYSRLAGLASTVTAELNKGSGKASVRDVVSVSADKTATFKVRKTWDDEASQIGAFGLYRNAVSCANAHPGYCVFDADGKLVYPKASGSSTSGTGASKTPKKTDKPKLPYKVKVDITDLNIRTGPGTKYKATGKFTGKGAFTIDRETDGWGRLKSGAGWICLKYTSKA